MNNGLPSRNFPPLTKKNINIIFSHVYDFPLNETISIEDDKKLQAFLPIVLNYAFYVQNFRYEEMHGTYGFVCNIVGDIFDINSEGTDCWLSLIMAMEELYTMTRSELAEVLQKIKFDK